MGLTNKYMVISSGYDGYNGIIHPLNGKKHQHLHGFLVKSLGPKKGMATMISTMSWVSVDQ